METNPLGVENKEETIPKDISSEFLSMAAIDFLEFLFTQSQEKALSIVVDWKDANTARRLKAFLEDPGALRRGQKRFATIRATEEQYKQELNVFSSRVKWEKIQG